VLKTPGVGIERRMRAKRMERGCNRKSEAGLSESDASQVIALLKDVDSVELKLRRRAGNRQLMPARDTD
jgi:hypothetical protein